MQSPSAFRLSLMLLLSACLLYAPNQNYSMTVYVFLSNGSAATNASASLYLQDQGTFSFSPTPANQSFSNTSGFINFTFNASPSTFARLSISAYNETGILKHTMPIMDMPVDFLPTFFNRSNVTVYPAAYIFLNASNGSTATAINFSGILLDAKTDDFVDEFMAPGQNNAGDANVNRTILVLRERNYTLVAAHHGKPQGGDYGKAPRTISITSSNLTNDTNALNQFVLTVNFSETKSFVSGNLSICGNPSTLSNLTYHALWLYPSAAGKTPLLQGIMGEKNLAPALNVTPLADGGLPFTYDLSQSGSGAYYNFSLSGSPNYGGINYLAVVLARNGTQGADGATYYGAFQNFTITGGNTSMNLTLCNLSGTYMLGSAVGRSFGGTSTNSNTSRFRVYLNDSDQGQAVSQGMMMAVVNLTNGSGNGPVNAVYLVDSNSSGYINFPVHANTTMTLKFFNAQFAPRKKLVNSNLNTSIVQAAGFKPQKPDGEERSSLNVQFLTYNASAGSTCNTQQPNLNACLRFRFGTDGGGFNPLKFNEKGSLVNVLINDSNGSGMLIYFVGVDLFASGPPDAVFSDPSQSNSGTTAERATQIGSSAPEMFEYAYVGIPYSDSSLDDSANISVALRKLYDEDGNHRWNSTANPNGTDVPAEFGAYNQSFFNSSRGGMPCSNNTGSDCFLNSTTNVIWLKIPHFSSSDAIVQGTAVSLASSSSSSDSYAQRDLALSTRFTCPDNQLVVSALSRVSPVKGVGIRLLDELSNVAGDDQTTNSSGEVSFTILSSGTYKAINNVKASSYRKPDPVFTTVTLCPLPGVISNTTSAPAPGAQPPAAPNPQPPAAPSTPPSAPTAEPPAVSPAPAVAPAPAPAPATNPTPVPAPIVPPATPSGPNTGIIVGVVVVIAVALGAIYFFFMRGSGVSKK